MVKQTYDRTGRLWFKFLHNWGILWPGHVLHPLRCISCCSVIERSSLLVFKSPRFSKRSIVKLIDNLLRCFDLNCWQVRRLYGNTCKGSLCLPWLACRWASEGHCVVQCSMAKSHMYQQSAHKNLRNHILILVHWVCEDIFSISMASCNFKYQQHLHRTPLLMSIKISYSAYECTQKVHSMAPKSDRKWCETTPI